MLTICKSEAEEKGLQEKFLFSQITDGYLHSFANMFYMTTKCQLNNQYNRVKD